MSLVGQRRSFLSSLPILSSSLPGRICCTRTMLGTEPRRSSSMLRGRSSAFDFLFAKALRGIGRRPLYPVAAASRRQLELHEADARSAEGEGGAGLVRCHQRRCGSYSPLQPYGAGEHCASGGVRGGSSGGSRISGGGRGVEENVKSYGLFGWDTRALGCRLGVSSRGLRTCLQPGGGISESRGDGYNDRLSSDWAPFLLSSWRR